MSDDTSDGDVVSMGFDTEKQRGSWRWRDFFWCPFGHM